MKARNIAREPRVVVDDEAFPYAFVSIEGRATIKDAVTCHFDENERPGIIHLHFVREEMLVVA